MFKTGILALVAATAAASTQHQKFELDVFNAQNFISGGAVMNLLQGAVQDLAGQRLKDGHVKWSACPTIKEDGFTIDGRDTYAKPDPVKKGIEVTLHLGGFATRDLDITSTTITAIWDGVQLYSQEFPNVAHVDEQDDFHTELSWPVPSFAPSGHFKCQVVINGMKSNGKTGPVACQYADFDL